MGKDSELQADDGFSLGVYEAYPDGKPKGSIVVLQEIFGVNTHIREVVDRFADAGYFAVAPFIFDRVEKGIELGYSEDDMAVGIEIAFQKLNQADAISDIQVVIDRAKEHGNVGLVGFCFGGLLTWLSACRLAGLSAAVSYYGGGVTEQKDLSANCPVIMHFGELDEHISMESVKVFEELHPEIPIYVYPADHGFNCDHRASYNEGAAKKAMGRTLDFFEENL